MSAGFQFELKEPMVSWSETGAHVRPTETTPTWSAIVGLISAALGLSRNDERIAQISTDFAMAVEVIRAGSRLDDYQTIQSPDAKQSQRLRANTRLDELSVSTINTTITRREYVMDAHYRILVLACSEDPIFKPTEIVAALRNPKYSLYVGRRSCPIGSLHTELVSGNIDSILPEATHWDRRLVSSRSPSLIRERRDLRLAGMRYGTRMECVA